MIIIGLTGQSLEGRKLVSNYLASIGFVVIESRSWFDAFVAKHNKAEISQDAIEKIIRDRCPLAFCDPIEKIVAAYGTASDRILVPDILHVTEANWIRNRGVLWHIADQDSPLLIEPSDDDLIIHREPLTESMISVDEALFISSKFNSGWIE